MGIFKAEAQMTQISGTMADLKRFTSWVRLWSRGLFPIPLRSLRLCVFHPLAALRFNRDVRPLPLRSGFARRAVRGPTPAANFRSPSGTPELAAAHLTAPLRAGYLSRCFRPAIQDRVERRGHGSTDLRAGHPAGPVRFVVLVPGCGEFDAILDVDHRHDGAGSVRGIG